MKIGAIPKEGGAPLKRGWRQMDNGKSSTTQQTPRECHFNKIERMGGHLSRGRRLSP
jgi:hypothetical protein